MAYKIVIRRNGKTHGEMGPYSSPQAANADANTIKIRLSGDADVVVQRVEVGGVKYVPRPPQSSGSAPSAPSYKPSSGSGYKPSSAMPYVPAAPRIAAGGVVVNDDGLILVREPLNHFDGYVWSLPKGGVDKGESDEQGALREVEEETGVRAEIVERIPGEWKSTSATNRYFLMKPVEVTGVLDNETQQIAFVTYDEAKELISLTTNKRGRERDLAVLDAGYGLWLARKHATKSNPRRVFANPSPVSPDIPDRAPRTAAFKRWFSGSKVVDRRGKPLVVFHGSRRPFAAFDYSRWGQTDPGFAGKGFYFIDHMDYAKAYAEMDAQPTDQPTVIAVYLRMENPFVVNSFDDVPGSTPGRVPTMAQAEEMQRRVRALGYDGVIVRGNPGNPSEYIVFDPAQVKAVDNAGTFDPADPNMRRNSRHRTHRFA